MIAIAAILLSGGDVPLIDGDGNGDGEFLFDLGKVQASPITRTPPAELRDVAQEAGSGVRQTMDELYLRAFLDPSSWGDYGAAFELFEDSAAEQAETDVEILTLGSNANADFESIDDASGTLTISVLTDAKDRPVTAVAQVEFEATAASEGGRTQTQVVSVGSFFLREVDGAWRIFAYQVDRNDAETGGPDATESPS